MTGARPLCLLFFAAVFSAALRFLPGATAPLGCLLAAMAATGLTAFFARGRALPERLSALPGGGIARLVLTAVLALAAASELRSFACRVRETLLPDAPLWVLVMLMAVAAFWVARGGIAALGRLGQLTVPVVAAVFVGTFLLCTEYFDVYNLVPTGGVLDGICAPLALLATALTVPVFVSDAGKRLPLTVGAAGLMMTAAVTAVHAVLGPVLAERIPYSFTAAIRAAGVPGALERVESAVAAISAMSDLLLTALLLLTLSRLNARPTPGQPAPMAGTAIPAAIVTGTALLLTAKEFLPERTICLIAAAAAAALPVYLAVTEALLRRKRATAR
ncbi:MAG: GerAB/ArcD/ProY family transporter [Eubacteriales bacterium]|nr:GerAB/ArcD/ProY family transporter [Eubacteriales bacterium]